VDVKKEEKIKLRKKKVMATCYYIISIKCKLMFFKPEQVEFNRLNLQNYVKIVNCFIKLVV
jgi:hypothetical protein